MATGAELGYNINATALQMANSIFGQGVTVVGASYQGDSRSSAIYSNGDALSPGVVPGDTGVILSTGQARDFTQSGGDPNRSSSTTTNTSGANNDPLLNAIAGTSTFDASILNVDFIPTGNVMTMRFVFSSEEYPEFAASQFNDIVGVWINGTHVPLAVGNGNPSVTNIGPTNSSNLFVDNTADQFNTEMDGFTLTMSLTIPVNAGVVNSIRIGIADVSDSSYDSNLLIAGNSGQTRLIAIPDHEKLFVGQTKTIDVLGNDQNFTGGTLTITHINGVAVLPGQSVLLPSGDTVTLNADGTLTVQADADVDTFHFTYDVQSSTGLIDTGMVTISTIPCFVAGTLIRTPSGDRPVESLAPGDLVMTHDDGAQPLRWTGRRSVPATGTMAPIRIRAGTFGPHGTLMLSPQHRVLVRDSAAELLFGEAEVLVAAKDLVNGRSIRVVEGGMVDYVHLLFDRHQVIFSEGLATESFLPGPQTTQGFETEIVAEIYTLFPEIDPATGLGYGASVRRALKAHEARVLMAEGRAA
ncbi:MAG: 2,3,4,5-tetrahydropyridine-2,6-carboxylate N-succinyltransferase [Alphaproteobacteria bacterium HGW-Alphaproteobacteria-6]|nr:MAG: 2,3,4,5-tetrahydropyridine-2,6-carboxylate N-succinyltransferase [Alphaproteobacteria bacterium HGW-Alphaproteobacteria-6]